MLRTHATKAIIPAVLSQGGKGIVCNAKTYNSTPPPFNKLVINYL